MRPLDSEILRPLVTEFLVTNPKTQLGSVYCGVAEIMKRRSLFQADVPGVGYQQERLLDSEEEVIRLTLWEFIIEGVLVPGKNSSNPDLPWISVTPYGKKCFESGEIQPYDPDGYLEKLRAQIPSLDAVVCMYIEESLQAFRRGLMLSSTAMLGGASERTAELVFTSFVTAITDKGRRERLEREILKERSYKTAFDIFRAELKSLPQSYLPAVIRDDLGIHLDGILNWIRVCRNDVGHPTGRKIVRSLAHSNLQLFIPYCRRAYDLIAHFDAHPI